MENRFKIPDPPELPKVEPKMHIKPCKNCPSAHFPPDPEVEVILTWSHEDKLKTVFPCGWNGKRYCKGYCDSMGVTNDDLVNLHEKRKI